MELEAKLLEIVGYDLSPEDPIYEELAELEDKLGQQSQETIKVAVQNPAVAFKLGASVLLSAIEGMLTGGLMELKNGGQQSRESQELRSELMRLRSTSPSFKRLVSPSRS